MFHSNTKAWSGDHCIDPSLVPGVLFCNRPVETEDPRLMDIGPTVLDMFGVEVPSYMDGRPLVVADAPDGEPSRTTGPAKNPSPPTPLPASGARGVGLGMGSEAGEEEKQ